MESDEDYQEDYMQLNLPEASGKQVAGVHWDSHKLLVGMGSMLACKVVDTNVTAMEHVWSCSIGQGGFINGLAACPRFVVLLNSFRGEFNDQIAVLSVDDHPNLARGHGVAARGARALGYISELGPDSDSEDGEEDEEGDEGDEGEEGEEGEAAGEENEEGEESEQDVIEDA